MSSSYVSFLAGKPHFQSLTADLASYENVLEMRVSHSPIEHPHQNLYGWLTQDISFIVSDKMTRATYVGDRIGWYKKSYRLFRSEMYWTTIWGVI